MRGTVIPNATKPRRSPVGASAVPRRILFIRLAGATGSRTGLDDLARVVAESGLPETERLERYLIPF